MSNEEQVFLNLQGAKVTSARVILGNQTFAMAGITSVEVRKIYPKTSYMPGLITIFIALIVMGQPDQLGSGAIFLVIGIAIIWHQISKPVKYALMLRAAGGEVMALDSEVSTDIELIANAITEAIVHRG